MIIKTTLLFFGVLGAALSAAHHYETHLARDVAAMQRQDAAPKPAKTSCRLKSTYDPSRLHNLDQLDQPVSQ